MPTSGSTSTGRSPRQTAMLLIKALEPYQPMFIEEPVECQNVDGLAEIAKKTFLPIATGERIFTKWGFREILEKRAASILQPDLCHAGGITEVRLIAGMAEAYYAAIAPHNPMGPISLAAGIQLAASIPNFLCQEQVTLGEGYIKEPFVVKTATSISRRDRDSASNWTRRRWRTRSITTGETPKPTTPTTARWWTGRFPGSWFLVPGSSSRVPDATGLGVSAGSGCRRLPVPGERQRKLSLPAKGRTIRRWVKAEATVSGTPNWPVQAQARARRWISGSARISRATWTFSLTNRSSMPTARKSAPCWNAYRNPSRGLIAPAARTLNPIQGVRELFMNSTVCSGNCGMATSRQCRGFSRGSAQKSCRGERS